jgi:hypothetical protein
MYYRPVGIGHSEVGTITQCCDEEIIIYLLNLKR